VRKSNIELSGQNTSMITRSVPVQELVPGDVIELIAGDLILADARLIQSRDLYVNQALLTGICLVSSRPCKRGMNAQMREV